MKRIISTAMVAVLALAVPAGAYTAYQTPKMGKKGEKSLSKGAGKAHEHHKSKHPKSKHPKPKHPKPKPSKPPKHPKGHKHHKHHDHKSKRCVIHLARYKATGALATAGTSLNPGSRHRYSGTIEVGLLKVNHRPATGNQTFTLSNVKISFKHGVSATTLADSDLVKLDGKRTELPKGCSSAGFTPAITIKKIEIGRPELTKP